MFQSIQNAAQSLAHAALDAGERFLGPVVSPVANLALDGVDLVRERALGHVNEKRKAMTEELLAQWAAEPAPAMPHHRSPPRRAARA